MVNLDPKIQIRYIDTKRQLADVLTKGNFTRDEWNNLVHLFNISHFSSLCCAKNFRLICCITKGWRKGCKNNPEKTDCGEIQANGYEPDQFCCCKFFSCEQSDCVEQREESLSTGKLVAMTMNEYPGCSGKSKDPEDSGDSEPKSRIWPHHFSTSPDYVLHIEKVFSVVRKIYDRKPTDKLKDLDVNTAIWDVFMSVTLQAAVHLGRNYSINLRSVKNQSSKFVKQLFCTTEKLTQEQTEIAGLSTTTEPAYVERIISAV